MYIDNKFIVDSIYNIKLQGEWECLYIENNDISLVYKFYYYEQKFWGDNDIPWSEEELDMIDKKIKYINESTIKCVFKYSKAQLDILY